MKLFRAEGGKNMKKTTPLFVLGTILLFAGLSVSPALAQQQTDDITVSYIEEDGTILSQVLTLSDTEKQELGGILKELMEQIQTASDYESIISIFQGIMSKYSKHTGIQAILGFMMKYINRFQETSKISPFKQNVMILSSGFTNKAFAIKGMRISVHKTFATWFYSANSNILTSSNTIIVDPYPFSVKTLVGRQVGVMRGFNGFYITQLSTIANKQFTYFMGYARNAIGYDLPL